MELAGRWRRSSPLLWLGRRHVGGGAVRLVPGELIAQRNHRADDDDGGAFEPRASRSLSNTGDGARNDTLSAPRAVIDDGNRHIRCHAVLYKSGHKRIYRGQSHIDGDRLIRLDQRLPVELDLAVLAVAGDEDTGLGVVAVGEG